jgi:prepilin-type N-terminal cleavage/methylation domain-containing protein
MKPSDRHGFTLLELLLVMAILAVVAMVVVPRLAGSLASVRVGKSAEQVFAAAREGHARATLRGVRARLVLDFDQKAFWVEEERRPLEEPGRWSDLPGREDKPYTLADGVSFGDLTLNEETLTAGQAVIAFRPDGSADDALITLKNDSEDVRVVEVRGITGRVRILRDEEAAAATSPTGSAGSGSRQQTAGKPLTGTLK